MTVTVTYSADATLEDGAVKFNTADADADDTGLVSDTDTVTVREDVTLTIDKEFGSALTPANDDEVIAGSTGNTLKIQVTNMGLSEADNVTITDDLPAGLHATAVSTTAGTCSLVDSAGDADLLVDDVSCTLLHLGPGASVTVTVTYSADATLEDGAVKFNTADADADDTGLVSDTDTVTVQREADLSIVKTDGVATVAAGTSTTYTIHSPTTVPRRSGPESDQGHHPGQHDSLGDRGGLRHLRWRDDLHHDDGAAPGSVGYLLPDARHPDHLQGRREHDPFQHGVHLLVAGD